MVKLIVYIPLVEKQWLEPAGLIQFPTLMRASPAIMNYLTETRPTRRILPKSQLIQGDNEAQLNMLTANHAA